MEAAAPARGRRRQVRLARLESPLVSCPPCQHPAQRTRPGNLCVDYMPNSAKSNRSIWARAAFWAPQDRPMLERSWRNRTKHLLHRDLLRIKLGPQAMSDRRPFIPQQPTSGDDCNDMSVLCHRRTHALTQGGACSGGRAADQPHRTGKRTPAPSRCAVNASRIDAKMNIVGTQHRRHFSTP